MWFPLWRTRVPICVGESFSSEVVDCATKDIFEITSIYDTNVTVYN